MSSGSRADGKSVKSETLSTFLTNCRHLLQEMTVPSYVPNDTLLVGGSENPDTNGVSTSSDHNPSMLILTGPNYSGKSVYMKQVSDFPSQCRPFSHSALGSSDCFSGTDRKVFHPPTVMQNEILTSIAALFLQIARN